MEPDKTGDFTKIASKQRWTKLVILLLGTLGAISLYLSRPSARRVHVTEGVVRVGKYNYELNKVYLESQFSDLSPLLMSARAVPYVEEGKVGGFVFENIEPESTFLHLGYRPKDLIIEVNEIKLDNAGKALEAFQSLQSAKNFYVVILRNGKQIRLNYKVLE